jgi:hypothetical protein
MAHTTPTFDYPQALESHLNWVSDLQFHVTCGICLEPLQVRDMRGSALGRWLQEDGAAYGGTLEFYQLSDALEELHLIASVVASIANLKPNDQALRIFQNSPVFLHAASDVRVAMARFFKGLEERETQTGPTRLPIAINPADAKLRQHA